MRFIARIALLVVLLLGWVEQPVWGQKNTEQYWNDLNQKTIDAYQQGKYKEGIVFAEQARAYAVEHLGPKHPDTLTSINNLALLYDAQGDYGKAEPLLKQALQLSEKILGKEHPDTLELNSSMAMLYQDQGRYAEAESLFKRVLQLQKKVLKPDDSEIIVSLANLAKCLLSQGKKKEALPIVNEAMALAEQEWGKLNHKAVLAFKEGNYQQGIIHAEEAYAYASKYLGAEHEFTIVSIIALAQLHVSMGRYEEAEPLLKKALQLRRKIFGPADERTLNSMNLLAGVYESQGRYSEAEALYKKTLRFRREVLGSEHRDTLVSMNNLSLLYQDQGNYIEAEALCKETLQLRKKILGKEHPDTLTSVNNLASIYVDQGRYSEAESLFKEALKLREKVLGEKHPKTVTSINNLGGLYHKQERYSKAEELYKKALQLRKEVVGREHPDVLDSMNNLSVLYKDQGRYSEAESLYIETLQLREKVLGKEHPHTLESIDNLGTFYLSQERYSEAEPLLIKALQLKKRTLGQNHPNTLISISNLASCYREQGRYSEAEPLCKQAVELSEKILGKEHPTTLTVQHNYIGLLLSTGRTEMALHMLQEEESRLLSRAFQELYTSSTRKTRRLYLQSISTFQNVVLTLASQKPGKGYQQYAAEVILRWKQIYAEESGVQHRLLNLSSDPEIANLMTQLAATQEEVSRALHQQKEQQYIDHLIELVDKDETAMLAQMRHLKTSLEVKDVQLEQVLSSLPQHSGLIEYRLFKPIDFKTGRHADIHLAALLLFADSKKHRIIFHDLGTMNSMPSFKEFYNWLLGSFDDQLRGLKQLYISPDVPLNSIPFSSLRLPDGRFLVERQQINRLQTGRDLLEDKEDVPAAKGMVAIGGVNYGPQPNTAEQIDLNQIATSFRGAACLENGFAYLRDSRRETKNIFSKYKNNSNGAQLLGDDASEYNLKRLKQPPRILHLSTHGFYCPDEKKELADEAPLLLSGLALAGANNGLKGKLDKHGDDGLLYSLEVLGLNLHGTELVSLSACDTGKGVVDYSEGVYGLVRAFRTAGAANVLMTLTPVGDKASRNFMETFYENWLYPDNPEKNWFDGAKKSTRTPAEALHQTRLDFIHDNKPVQDWAPYVLVGK